MNASFVRIDAKTDGFWTQTLGSRLEFRSQYAVTRAAVRLTDASVVAFADKIGSIYVLHLTDKRFQRVAALHTSVTCLAFVETDVPEVETQLVIATRDRRLHLFKLGGQCVAAIESPHKTSINDVSFDGKQRMMTSSAYDSAVVWDVISGRKLKTLDDSKCQKSVFFGHNYVLSAYRDAVFVCDSHSFAVLVKLHDKHVHHVTDRFFQTKSAAQDIETHRMSGNAIRSTAAEAEPMPCDESETAVARNQSIVLALNSNSHLVVFRIIRTKTPKTPTIGSNSRAVQQMATLLLQKYSKFPQKYRFFIWTQLMAVPRDCNAFYRSLAANAEPLIPDIARALEERRFRDPSVGQRLAALLAQLIQWRPELLDDCRVDELALFCFPFVKELGAKRGLALAVCAALVRNNFFVDRPLKRTNLWSVVHSLVGQQTPRLAQHFHALSVRSQHYALPLMTSLFSEVFLRSDWLRVCDHLLLFGPQFVVYLVTAFCLQSQQTLLRLQTPDDINAHFRSQTGVSVDGVLSVAHSLAQQYVPNSDFHFIPIF